MKFSTSPAIAGTSESPSAESGFTLVELMVVVAIIALLAAIIIPNYVHARAQAAVSESEANIKQIATSLELYYADKQTYPGGTAAVVAPALFGGTGNPYMTSNPTNALGRGVYNYTFTAAAGGVPQTYQIIDSGTYDPTTLTSLPAGPGAAAQCATCTKIEYDPQNGLYGA